MESGETFPDFSDRSETLLWKCLPEYPVPYWKIIAFIGKQFGKFFLFYIKVDLLYAFIKSPIPRRSYMVCVRAYL